MLGTVPFVVADTAALAVADTAALVVVDIAEADTAVVADTAALAVAGTAALATAAFAVAGIGESGTVVAGTAALAVPIVYPSCSLFHLPSDRLSTHPHPYPFHNPPLGIMGSHAFACIVLPKMVLFRTL